MTVTQGPTVIDGHLLVLSERWTVNVKAGVVTAATLLLFAGPFVHIDNRCALPHLETHVHRLLVRRIDRAVGLQRR